MAYVGVGGDIDGVVNPELEEAGAITFNRQTVTVLKPDVLQAIALI